MTNQSNNPMTFAAVKITLLQALAQNKAAAAVSPIIGVILEFILSRWQADVLLFILVFVAVGINTFSGIFRAKVNKEFDPKILREKTQIKIVAYLTWLVLIYVVALAIQIAAFLDTGNGEPLIDLPKSVLHYPITCTYLFFVLVEGLSVQKNLKALGEKIPNFSINQLKKILPTDDDEKTS